MKWNGTLRFVDLGPGQWVLDTKGGRMPLYGPVPENLRDAVVEVEGHPQESMGFGMVGGDQAIVVAEVRRAS